MARPLVLIVFSYIIGILLSCGIAYSASVAFIGAAFLFVLALTGYFRFWRGNLFIILILFMVLGAASGKAAVERSDTGLAELAGHYVTVIGTIVQDPDVRPDKIYLVLKCQEVQTGKGQERAEGLLRVRVPAELVHTIAGTQTGGYMPFSYGDVVRVNGLLNAPEPPGNPGAFDYRAYLLRQGIRVELFVREVTLLHPDGLSGGKPRGTSGTDNNADSSAESSINAGFPAVSNVNPLTAAALSFKRTLTGIIDASFSAEKGALLKGIMLGERGMIDKETSNSFVNVGTIHLLCVSGFHVGLVMAVVILISRLLRFRPKQVLLFNVPVLVFYALMTGLPPSVLRATIMAMIFLAAHAFGRDRDWPTTLSFAALVILAVNPLSLFNPGFQLSFAATWGILYLAPLLGNVFKFLPPWLETPLKVTLAAQLGVLPLVAVHYNIVSVVSLLANVIAVPLVTVVMVLGLTAVLAGLVTTSITVFVAPAIEVLLELLLFSGKILSVIPGAVFNTASPPVFVIALWYAVLFAVGKFFTQNKLQLIAKARFNRLRNNKKLPLYQILGLLLVVLLAFTFFWGNAGGGEFIVHFLDVGQGDSALLEFPQGKTILIDAGGRVGELESGTGVGDMVVAPYIRRQGINKIDLLVITHPHEDHAGGVRAVCETVKVGAVLVPAGADGNVPGLPDESYLQLIKDIKDTGIPVIVAGKGDIINLDDKIRAQILWPPKTEAKTPRLILENWNNRSLVLCCQYGEVTFLFAGDIEKEAQEMLQNDKSINRNTVLKIPHHGSANYSPAFVKKVAPKAAIISVGARNRFGHPSADIMQMLEGMGTKVYRTDEKGAIILKTDGRSVQVTTGKKL